MRTLRRSIICAGIVVTVGVLPATATAVPAPTPQGEAQLASSGRLLSGDRLRIKLQCVGAPAWSACRGRLRLTTRRPIRIRPKGTAQIVEVGNAGFAEITPGSSAIIVLAVKPRARYHLRRSTSTKAFARITDELVTGELRSTRESTSISRVAR